MKNFLRIAALLTLVSLPAAAASFTVNNTGQGTEGVADPYWVLSGGTAYVTISAQKPGAWMANTLTSSWISPKAGYPAGHPRDNPGTYAYSTTFDLTGLNPNTASLSFVLAADDEVTDVLLNGVSQGVAYIGFAAFSGVFTINSDFINGINTFTVVTNNAGSTPTPAGLRVEFTNATADEISGVPEPSSIALLGFGTILLFSRRFRTRK